MIDVKGMWKELSPRTQRILAISMIGGAIATTIAVASPNEEKGHRQSRQEKVENVITSRPVRELGVEALNAKIDNQQATMDRLLREFDALREKQERRDFDPKEYQTTLDLIQRKLDRLENTKPAAGNSAQRPDGTNTHESGADDRNISGRFGDAGSQSLAQGAVKGAVSGFTPKSMAISRVTQKVEAAEPRKADEDIFRLPATSILSATIITGLEAPTGKQARKDPFPALLRINKEALLPNRYTSDIRDCFMLMGGYGDLSSERAYLRGETVSCIREDGSVLEKKISAYVVGEDGKAGIRGRLVTKQGQFIARALMTGFMEGAAKAFDRVPVPTLQTNPTGGAVQYQSAFSPDAMQSAAVRGFGTALDRISQFYMDMAADMFPIIEIDAMRDVDIVVTKGLKMDFQQGADAPDGEMTPMDGQQPAADIRTPGGAIVAPISK